MKSHNKKDFSKGFSGKFNPLFSTIMEDELKVRASVQAESQNSMKRSRKGVKSPPLKRSKAQLMQSPSSESQHYDENIKRDNLIVRESSKEDTLLPLPGFIDTTSAKPNISISIPQSPSVDLLDQSDVLSSSTNFIAEVLIGLGKETPILDSSLGHVNNSSIIRAPTTTTRIEDVSFETFFDSRNPRRQGTIGDGEGEARPKAPSSPKDSVIVDEGSLKQTMMELTDTCTTLQKKVAELKSEVADLKAKVAKHDLIINTYPEHYVAPTKEESSHKVSSSSQGDAIKKGEIIVTTTKDTYEDIVSEEDDDGNVFEVLKKVLLQEGLNVYENSNKHLSLTNGPPVVLQPFNPSSEPYAAPIKEESLRKVFSSSTSGSSSSKGDATKKGEIIVTTSKDSYEDIVSVEDDDNAFEVLKKVLIQEVSVAQLSKVYGRRLESYHEVV